MSSEPSTTDQNVTRALRANLQGVQRQSEELQQAIADLVAACSSNRPSNALPHLLRAGGSAASLAAVLEVLAKFVAGSASSQPSRRAEDRVEERNGERATEPPVERASSPSFAAVEIAHTPAPNPEIVAAAIPAPPVIETPAHYQDEAPAQEVQEVHEKEARKSARRSPSPRRNRNPRRSASCGRNRRSRSRAGSCIEHPFRRARNRRAVHLASARRRSHRRASGARPRNCRCRAASGSLRQRSSLRRIVRRNRSHRRSAPDASSHNGHVAEGSIAEAMGFAATQPAPEASLEQSEVFDITSLPPNNRKCIAGRIALRKCLCKISSFCGPRCNRAARPKIFASV